MIRGLVLAMQVPTSVIKAHIADNLDVILKSAKYQLAYQSGQYVLNLLLPVLSKPYVLYQNPMTKQQNSYESALTQNKVLQRSFVLIGIMKDADEISNKTTFFPFSAMSNSTIVVNAIQRKQWYWPLLLERYS